MKRYDERILGKLLDRYEGSLLYSGKNQVNISISIPIQKKTLPEYFDESAMQFDIIHEQLEHLEEKGLIRLFWKNKKRGHILEKCELSVERADEAYRFLRRKPRRQKEQEIREILARYRGRERVLDAFLSWTEVRMQENEGIRRYVNVDNPKEFARFCELILRILTNQSECFLRQFSIRHFHDSKLAEKEIEKAAHVIAEFSGEEELQRGEEILQETTLSRLSAEELLEEYNIYRNPSWVMLKGDGVFQKGMTEIDLSAFPGGIGLSNHDIGGICWNREKRVQRIVTIENLTSFHQWNPGKSAKKEHDRTLCIYLGGYHNSVKRKFLKQLYAACSESEYYHFGDLDCGGFLIWKDLCHKTGIPFRPLFMDLSVYLTYLEWGRDLTAQDRKMLKEMAEEPFFAEQKELFERMLKEGKKLEQECICEQGDD